MLLPAPGAGRRDGGAVRWSTACDGGAADTAPVELAALQAHVGQCCSRHARLGAAHCALEAVQGFIGARLVTTLAAVVAVLGLSAWLWSLAAAV